MPAPALPADIGVLLRAQVSNHARIVVANDGTVLASAHVGGGRMVFDAGADVIDFLRTAATSLAFTGNTLLLEDGSQTVGTLQFASGYSLDNFALSSDGHSGSKITFVAPGPEHAAAHLG